MMRRSMTAGLMVGLLATGAGAAVQAQDERMGADLAYYEQVEVPEAGISLAFPPDWNVDIEMDQRQDFELTDEINEGEPVYFWNVLYASGGGRPWCDLVWWPDHPLSLDAQSLVYEWRTLPDPDSGVERTLETTPVDLGTGEAYRFDVYNEPTGEYTAAQLFESGSDRYLLSCVGDTFEEVDALEVSQTIGFIAEEPAPAVDAQRIEVPEAGIAVSFPADWDVEVEMERGELPADDPDAPAVEYWDIVSATAGESTRCDITEYEYQPGPLSEYADDLALALTEDQEDVATAEVAPVQLAVGEAYRVDVDDASADRYTTVFLYDEGASRSFMVCVTDDPGSHDLLGIAQSIERLGDEPPVEPEPSTEPGSEPAVEPVADGQRVEVPEAGVALTLPEGWTHEISMESSDDYQLSPEDDDGSTVVSTDVLSAYPARGLGACGVSMYEGMPMSFERHAEVTGVRLSGSEPSMTPVVTVVDLPVGEAARVDFRMVALDYPAVAYLFDLEGMRYQLDCWSEDPPPDGWLSVAQSLAPLDGTSPDASVLDDQRIEVTEAGIVVSFPADWDVEIEMDRSEMRFDDPEAEPIEVLNIVWATTDGPTWCDLVRHGSQVLSLPRDAQSLAHSVVEGKEDTVTSQFSPVQLAVGEAYRVDKHDSSTGETTTRFMFDEGTSRFTLTCFTDEPGSYDFLAIARSLEILGKPLIDIPPEPIEPEVDAGRVEVPEAGLALSLPEGWILEMDMETSDYRLPDDADDGSSVTRTNVFSVYPGGHAVCGHAIFEPMPMSPMRHAWETAIRISAVEPAMTPELTEVQLPLGEAVRADYITFTERPASAYVFDLGGTRHVFDCWAETADRDAWHALVETFESLTAEPPAPALPSVEVPEDAVAWDEVRDFGSVVPVLDADIEASLMSAWCDRSLWIAYDDGTFQERFECTLSDELVDPPEWQAPWPTESVTVAGGECEWVSDFWTMTDGSEVWATSYAVAVEPDGRVVGRADYAPEVLECEEE